MSGTSAVRPRYGRLCAAGAATLVTAVTFLGGSGLLPVASSSATARVVPAASLSAAHHPTSAPEQPAVTDASAAPVPSMSAASQSEEDRLPANSGRGRRIVFDMARQRVWLVERGHRVRRTFLVSGSLTDNLKPGTYHVWSRSRHAIGVDDSGTMEFFVRFAHGPHAAIGFHSIPVKDGKPLQSAASLGTPQSHGCVRERRPDAVALWRFAPTGTKVVVTG